MTTWYFQGGDLDDPNNYSGGPANTLPGPGDTVVGANDLIVDATSGSLTVGAAGDLNIDAGASLTVGTATGVSALGGIVDATNATDGFGITISDGGQFDVSDALDVTQGAHEVEIESGLLSAGTITGSLADESDLSDFGGTVILTNLAPIIVGVFQGGSLTINAAYTTGSTDIDGTGSTLDVSGTLTVGNDGLTVADGASETWSDVVISPQVQLLIEGGTDGSGSVHITHSLNFNGGTLELADNGSVTLDPDITISNGDFIVQAQTSGSSSPSTALLNGNLTLDPAAAGETAGLSVTNSTLTLQGNFTVDNGAGARIFNGTMTVHGTNGVSIGVDGTASVLVDAGGQLTIDHGLALGVNSGSQGTLTISDVNNLNAPATVSIGGDAMIGGLIPTSPNANNDSNETGADWTYTGGVGTLTVADDGAVTVSGNLTLQDSVETKSDGTEVADGGIKIEFGGSLDVGGSAVAPTNTLQIADGASLEGHGQIAGTVTGQVQVTDTTTTPTYSLNIDNSGTIEADEGMLVLDGNLSGDGQVLVGKNSTLEFGGSVADDVTAMFLPGGDGTITIDDPNNFKGVISSENFEPGDKIDLPNVSYVSPNSDDLNPDGASFQVETGEDQQNYVLQIVENDQTYDIPINQDNDQFSGGFTLSDDGHGGTLVTYTSGSVTGFSETATADGVPSSYAGVVHVIQEPRQGKAGPVGSGTGFAVGPHLVLTAAHVAVAPEAARTGDVLFVQLASGLQLPGAVIAAGTLQPVASDPSSIASDWAYVYVPGANFTPDQTFYFKTYFRQGEVNITGYPTTQSGHPGNIANGLLPNPANLYPVPITNNQYTLTGEVSGSGTFPSLLSWENIAGFLGHGFSGGPVWTYSRTGLKAVVGIVSTKDYAVATSQIPKYSGVANVPFPFNLVFPFFVDPPSDAARITSATLVQTGVVDTGQTVRFFLNMSENVVVTDSGPTLTLNDGGTATYDAADSVGTELVFDYTVGASDQISNLEIAGVSSAQTVEAPGGASVDFSVIENLPTGLSINSPLTVAPVASSQTGEVGTGQLVQLTLTMSEAAIVNTAGGAPTLWLNDGETASYDAAASNPSGGKLVFDYTVASGDEIANLEIASVNLPTGTTVQDAGGNNADFSSAINVPTGLQVGPAYITAINSSQSSELTTGQTDQLTLAMSQGVTVGGSPTLSLNDGATATYDAAASNPSTGTLVFDYTVGSSDYTSDLQVLSYNPNGSTVTDTHGVDADFSGATQYDLGLDVNAAIVTNLTVSPASGEADGGEAVTLTLTMNEAVTVNLTGGSPTLTLNADAIATYDSAASNPSAGTLVFAYTVGVTDETPSLQVSEINLNGATINDGNGNAADLSAAANFTTNLQVGSAFVSSVTPALSGEIFTGQTDELTLAMSQAVTVNTTNGSPTLRLSDGVAATYDSAASDPSSGTLVFDYTVGASDHSTDLQVVGYDANGATVTDANGVNADFSAAAQGLALDVNAAIVTGVTSSPSTGEADSGQAVTVTLAMSEAVTVNTGGGSPTLSLSTGATAAYDSNASNPSNGTLVFDYTVGATDETHDLSVIQVNLNGAVINDGNGNTADLSAVSNFDTGLQVGPVFVEAVSPSLSGFIATGQTVQLALGMSAGLTVNTTNGSPTLGLSDGATASYDAAASDPSSGSLVFDYMVGANDHATDLTVLTVNPDGATITDANGVSPDFSGVAQFDLGLAVNTPIVTNVTASPSTAEADSGQLVKLTLALSEAVTVNTTGGSPTLYLSDGAIAIYDAVASNPSAGSLVFDYTVGATDSTSNLQIAQVNLNGVTISDASGNAADLSAATTIPTGLQIGPAFVDSLTPSVIGQLTPGQTVQLTIAMSGGVRLNTGAGLPTLTLSNGATATYDTAYSAPSAGTLVFDYTVGANQLTTNLQVTSVNFPSLPQDSNGQNADFADVLDRPLGLSVGTVLPIITAIAETPSTGELTVGGSGTLALTINEDVTVTGTPTLSLNDGGAATFDAGESSPTSLVFDYAVTSSDSSVSSLTANLLNMAAGDSIVDGSGNSLNTSLSGLAQIGPEITISSPPPPTSPVITAIAESPSAGDLNVGNTGTFALTTNESVTVTGTPTLSLNDHGTATYDAAESTGTDLVFNYSVTSSDSNVSSLAATGLNVPSGVSIEDGSGNSLNTSLSGLTQTGPEISISSSPSVVPPTISGTVAQQTTTSEAPIDPFSGVTVSDPNAGATDTLTITLSTTGANFGTLSGTGLSGSGSTYQLSGAAAAVTSELDALSYIAVDGVPGTSVTTTFTLSDQSSAFPTPTTNNTTSVIDTDPAPAPPPVNFPQVANSNVDEWILASGQWAASAEPGSIPSGYEVAGTGDFTGNGTSDILWFNGSTGDTQEWLINNGGWAGTVDLGTHPGNFQIAGVGDFTGNGIGDVLWTSSSGGQVQTDIWELSSNGQWQASVSPGSHPAGYDVVGIGDFTGNGTSDILWQNPTTGDVDEWQIVNGQWSASVDLGSHPGTGWTIAGIGDFTGNGIDDVLWTNSSGGQVQTDIWELGPNGQWVASISPGTHPAGYSVVGVGNFTDNGTNDILLQNATTGDVDEWDLGNGKWAASIDLGSHPGNFQLAGTGAFVNGNATSDMLWHSPS